MVQLVQGSVRMLHTCIPWVLRLVLVPLIIILSTTSLAIKLTYGFVRPQSLFLHIRKGHNSYVPINQHLFASLVRQTRKIHFFQSPFVGSRERIPTIYLIKIIIVLLNIPVPDLECFQIRNNHFFRYIKQRLELRDHITPGLRQPQLSLYELGLTTMHQ